MSDDLDDVTKRIVLDAMREGRDIALCAAIETAKMFLDGEHTVACVVRALEDLRGMTHDVAPRPSKAN